MAKNHFSNKIWCEFIITSDTINPEKLTKKLKVEPHRYFAKGDTYKSKHTGSLITRPHNLWAISSGINISVEQDITSHILELKLLLKDSIDELKKLKKSDDVEITLWLWFETEDAGIGIDILEPEIAFIYSITNRLHFSMIADIELIE